MCREHDLVDIRFNRTAHRHPTTAWQLSCANVCKLGESGRKVAYQRDSNCKVKNRPTNRQKNYIYLV